MICKAGHLNYDDAIIYPGQPGRAHLHQYFGNTETNAFSTYQSLRASGNSTCQQNGPTEFFPAANRSAYWFPAMLDGIGNVVRPEFVTVYYKRRPSSDPLVAPGVAHPQKYGTAADIPNGLRFVFGWNMLDPAQTRQGSFYFICESGDGTHLPDLESALANCPVGGKMSAVVIAPDCWDGKNLDSPDRRSHLAYAYNTNMGYFRCPDSHPYTIPTYQLMATFLVDANKGTWRLSSDSMNPGGKRGSTMHADFMEAWDPTVKKIWHEWCINKPLNCTGGAIGNGQMLKGATGSPWTSAPRLVPVPAPPTAMHHQH